MTNIKPPGWLEEHKRFPCLEFMQGQKRICPTEQDGTEVGKRLKLSYDSREDLLIHYSKVICHISIPVSSVFWSSG